MYRKSQTMSPMRTTNENPFDSYPDANSTEYDDLKKLKGIGPAREQWLRDTFHVRTFHDLASLSADEIELQLKAEGKVVTLSTIETWIAEAAHLASQAEHPEPQTAEEVRPAAREGWKPFASFVVEFQERETETGTVQQTVIHHMEADQSETWSGVEYGAISGWIAGQLGAKILQPPASNVVTHPVLGAEAMFSQKLQEVLAKAQGMSPERPEPAPPTERAGHLVVMERETVAEEPVIRAPATTPLQVRITRLQAVQFAAARKPLNCVTGGEPFALEAVLELTGLDAVDVENRPAALGAEFYASNLATGSVVHLGSISPVTLSKDVTSHKVTMPEATLGPGMYRVQVVVKFEGVPVMGYLDVVPLIQAL
jgi:predicted flap endonuclease-1-like 5' DNA nuclease